MIVIVYVFVDQFFNIFLLENSIDVPKRMGYGTFESRITE